MKKYALQENINLVRWVLTRVGEQCAKYSDKNNTERMVYAYEREQY